MPALSTSRSRTRGAALEYQGRRGEILASPAPDKVVNRAMKNITA